MVKKPAAPTNILAAALVAALLTGCSDVHLSEMASANPARPGNLVNSDVYLLGLTVQEAADQLALKLGRYFIIEEPPDVVRGVKGKDVLNEEVWLYVNRIEVRNEYVQDWSFEKVSQLKVVGVARLRGNRWHRCGHVIWYYHSD